MEIKEVPETLRVQFNKLVSHPMQSWEWGEFREKTGVKTIRIGEFDQGELISGYQFFVHKIPHLPFSIIYFPRGPLPTKPILETLTKYGSQEHSILAKMEPNVYYPAGTTPTSKMPNQKEHRLVIGQPFFIKHTFLLDISRTEEEILSKMKPKTRYNIKISQKHNVEIIEDNSKSAFEKYYSLTEETTKRQGFWAHTKEYHRKMWETLSPKKMYHILLAKYKGKVVAAYIFFTFNNIIYYPYGASSRLSPEAMAPYAIFWEAIKLGKKYRCKSLDMWGSLGLNPDKNDPRYGFHHFKSGFGGTLMEYIGTYDLVINPITYPLYNLANNARWILMRLKPKL